MAALDVYSYEQIRNGATFLLDTTTAEAIKAKPQEIQGKVVTFVDNYTVGYGSAGDEPAGFVEQVEIEANYNPTQYVVSVVFNQSREDVSCAGSETAGSYAACDGKGGLQAATTATSAKIWGVDTEAKTCTVYIRG